MSGEVLGLVFFFAGCIFWMIKKLLEEAKFSENLRDYILHNNEDLTLQTPNYSIKEKLDAAEILRRVIKDKLEHLDTAEILARIAWLFCWGFIVVCLLIHFFLGYPL